MRWKLAGAIAAGLLVGMIAYRAGTQPDARAEDQPARQRVEYKVVFSPVSHLKLLESRLVDGKEVIIEHGPKASAEAMTKQFNALAAEGWEYVGPVTPTGKQGG